MSTIVLVSSWYTAGLLAAAVMIDRGRSAVVWWTAAAILGGLTAGAALLATAGQRRSEASPWLEHTSVGASGNGGVMLVCRPGERSEDLMRWLRRARPRGPSTVACAVGVESFRRWVDTGEVQATQRTFRRAVERLGPDVGTVLLGGRADAVLTRGATDPSRLGPVDAVVVDPDVLLPVDRPGGGRVLAERVAALSASAGAPVVVMDPGVAGNRRTAVERSAVA